MGALAGIAFKWLLDPRVLGALAVTAVIVLGWWHYTGLKADLDESRQELAAAKTAMEQAVAVAESNATQLAEATQQHRATVALLEETQAEIGALREASRLTEQAIIAAPDEDDGPVAPLAHEWQRRRYGAE